LAIQNVGGFEKRREALNMDFDSKSNLVLSVSPGHHQQWHVAEPGICPPLATFDTPQAACAWALDYAKPKGGRVVVEKWVAAESGAVIGSATAAEVIFSIPVSVTQRPDARFRPARGIGSP
jgi:hypothetical protein